MSLHLPMLVIFSNENQPDVPLETPGQNGWTVLHLSHIIFDQRLLEWRGGAMPPMISIIKRASVDRLVAR